MKSRPFHEVYMAFFAYASSLLLLTISLLSLDIQPELPLVLWTCLWPFSMLFPLSLFLWLTLISTSGLGRMLLLSETSWTLYWTYSLLYLLFLSRCSPSPGCSLHDGRDYVSLASSRVSPGECLRNIYWMNTRLISQKSDLHTNLHIVLWKSYVSRVSFLL